jgi:hypothetical protein
MTTQQHNRSTPSATDPFQSQGEIDENAYIDNYMGFDQLSAYYVTSADALVECSLRDHCLLGAHIYAICFLYRQGLELILKDMVWKSHYLLTGEKRFMLPDWGELGRHRLTDLWKQCRSDSERVLPDGWPLGRKDDGLVAELLLQFECHDPDSYSFRYPIGKKTGRTHQGVNNINIRVLGDSMHEARDRLAHVLDQLNWCCEKQHE